jgi:hypothetical protein
VRYTPGVCRANEAHVEPQLDPWVTADCPGYEGIVKTSTAPAAPARGPYSGQSTTTSAGSEIFISPQPLTKKRDGRRRQSSHTSQGDVMQCASLRPPLGRPSPSGISRSFFLFHDLEPSAVEPARTGREPRAAWMLRLPDTPI